MSDDTTSKNDERYVIKFGSAFSPDLKAAYRRDRDVDLVNRRTLWSTGQIVDHKGRVINPKRLKFMRPDK